MSDAYIDEEIKPEEDPFSPENVGTLQFITLARIYDVLLVQLQLDHPEAAQQLLKHHAEGSLLGPQPFLNGRFIFDEDDA